MPKFAANLSFLFTEVDFPQRFALAAAAGFRGVEYLFPYDYPAEQIATWLAENHLEQVLFNLPAGNWAAGERGMACHPGRETEFAEGLELAIAYAKILGCTRLHAMSGLRPAGSKAADEAEITACFIHNIRHAATRCASAGIRLLIEPINSRIDMPGYYLDTPEKAFALREQIAHPNVFVQYDMYHAHIMTGDVGAWLEQGIAHIQHCQLADFPGRHEPGTGEIPYQTLLPRLDQLGYQGWVGCEYKPLNSTSVGLHWRDKFSSNS